MAIGTYFSHITQNLEEGSFRYWSNDIWCPRFLVFLPHNPLECWLSWSWLLPHDHRMAATTLTITSTIKVGRFLLSGTQKFTRSFSADFCFHLFGHNGVTWLWIEVKNAGKMSPWFQPQNQKWVMKKGAGNNCWVTIVTTGVQCHDCDE